MYPKQSKIRNKKQRIIRHNHKINGVYYDCYNCGKRRKVNICPDCGAKLKGAYCKIV